MSDNSQFKRLLEPGRIGTMTTRNRIVMPAMGTFFKVKDAQGRQTIDTHKAYYEARAKGGAGLVINEIVAVDYEGGRVYNEQLRLDDDEYIPVLGEIAEAVKKHGARVAVQLHHGGAAAKSSVTGHQPFGPSSIGRPGYDIPKELTIAEIADIVDRFAKTAERAKRAGFDGVEIAGAHRYLIAQFLSSAWNKRQDDYGGSLRNRARLLLDIIKAIKERVGTDYPVWCRLNGKEFGIEDGIVIEEAQQVAAWSEEAGVDAVNVSANPPLSAPYHAYDIVAYTLPEYGPGVFVPFAQAVKKVVRVPVIVAGKIDPELGEKVLRQGKADFIAMGRPLMADPELPNKLMSGRVSEIRPCLYCNCCIEPVAIGRDCTVNAAKGREREYEIRPAKRTKRIVVVGGGPAGMEAARVAALRGHQVTLYEKDRRLGGQLVLAGIMREEYNKLTKYLSEQMKIRGVKLNMGKGFTPALIESIKPDTVIVATGAIPIVPGIPGVSGDKVFNTLGIRQGISSNGRWNAWLKPIHWRRVLWSLGFGLLKTSQGESLVKWLMKFMAPFGRKVVVVGGGFAGLEMADYLVEKGKKVTIVESGGEVGYGERPMYLLMNYFLSRLMAKEVPMLTSVKYEEITDKGLVIRDKEGQRRLIEADTVVLALGSGKNDRLADELKGKVPEVHIIGDSAVPCGIREAIADGSRIGRMV